MYLLELDSKNIESLNISDNPQNIRKIKTILNNYKDFKYKCIDKLVNVQRSFIPSLINYPQHHSHSFDNYKYLKDYFEAKTEDNKSCFEKRKEFQANETLKQFINLPKKCSNNYFKTLIDLPQCETMLNKISPEYSGKNSNNLFYRCHEGVKKADKDCFGEEGTRNELQELLHLVNQKSTALCEDNKLARAEIARKKCFDRAIKTCWDSCQSEIEEFKSNYLECFFSA